VCDGLCCVYLHGATASIVIQDNWDASVPTDVVDLLRKLIPAGVWLHDRQAGNGDAHLKAGLVGPSETIPVIEGTLATLVGSMRSPNRAIAQMQLCV